MKELTFAMLKPHILKNSVAVDHIMAILNNKFKILESQKIYMNLELATKFYEEHIGNFYCDRLLQLMCSGPVLALVLEGENCIKKWRDLMGPTKVYKSIYTHPDTIRSLYGISDTRNVCHGADSIESVKREISIVFPNFKYENYVDSINSRSENIKSVENKFKLF